MTGCRESWLKRLFKSNLSREEIVNFGVLVFDLSHDGCEDRRHGVAGDGQLSGWIVVHGKAYGMLLLRCRYIAHEAPPLRWPFRYEFRVTCHQHGRRRSPQDAPPAAHGAAVLNRGGAAIGPGSAAID